MAATARGRRAPRGPSRARAGAGARAPGSAAGRRAAAGAAARPGRAPPAGGRGRSAGTGGARSYRRWSPREVEFLRRHRGKPNAWIAARVGVPVYKVAWARKANDLPRFRKRGRRMAWTPEEDAVLRASFHLRLSEICARLPDRPRISVSVRLRALGRRPLRGAGGGGPRAPAARRRAR